MKKIHLLMCAGLLLFSVIPKVDAQVESTALTETDLKLYDVVSKDFLSYLSGERPDIKQLNIINKTVDGESFSLRESQIISNLWGKVEPPLPDVIDNLISRNKTTASIIDFKPTHPNITLISNEMIPKHGDLSDETSRDKYLTI